MLMAERWRASCSTFIKDQSYPKEADRNTLTPNWAYIMKFKPDSRF